MSVSIHADKKGSKADKDIGTGKPKLLLCIAGKKKSLTPAEMRGSEGDALLKTAKSDSSQVVAHLSNLLDFTDADRMVVLDFAASLGDCAIQVAEAKHKDLLDAVLVLVPAESAGMETARKAKLAALETAVLKYPDALDLACGRIQSKMRELEYKGVRVGDLARDARKILAKITKAVTSQILPSQSVRVVLLDAPVPAEVVIPSGWRVGPTGVIGVGSDGGAIPAPVLISGRGRDEHRGTETVTLAWHRDGRWHQKIVDRGDIADARGIVRLAAVGLPVTSNNSKTLVQFLADFETANLPFLPSAKVSSKMGWQGTAGEGGFLWGRNLLGAHAVGGDPDLETEDAASVALIQFSGSDAGVEQLANGYFASGTLEGWLEAIRPLAGHPRLMFSLYASFVPPLLEVLNSPNFVVDLSGPTTTGKTTSLRAAASVWGCPDERSPHSVMGTWDSTAVWRERVPSVATDLPFFLDETKHVRNPDDVAKTIYAVVQGRGKGRGTPTGLARQDQAVTVLFTTGEQPATSFTQDGGTRARVLTLWGSPFGGTGKDVGQLVGQVNAKVKEHFGHAGPLFVQFLLDNRERWGQWRKVYAAAVRSLEVAAGDDSVAVRMAPHFAAVEAASVLVCAALQPPWAWNNVMAELWEELVGEAGQADRATAALRHVMSWAAGNKDSFYAVGKSDSHPPHGGWLGRWDINGESVPGSKKTEWSWIGFREDLLDQTMKTGGFDPNSTIRLWKDRGWLAIDAENVKGGGTVKRTTKATKFGKVKTRVVAVRRDAVEQIV